ncbi:DMT family transporter [Candidatus Microgenomates bacterium]|nr:MAG: DMT family transporter [Candidatus Microgenomates bacterium]
MSKTIISILAGLGGMFGWGTSDFLANQAADRIGAKRAFFYSQFAGVLLILIITLVTQQVLLLPLSLLIKLVYLGVVYALGYLFFYRGFEIGNVAVVSAVINLQAVLSMVVVFLFRGQRLTPIQIPAVFILLLGIFLVSVNFNELKKGAVVLARGVKETLLATIFFGILFWPYNEIVLEQNNLLWVTALTKIFALIFVFGVMKYLKEQLALSQGIHRNKSLWLLVAATGILEAGAMLSVNFGTQVGDGILVQPIAASLTVVTVSLALIFLKEKIAKLQALGIAMTICGIILTAL